MSTKYKWILDSLFGNCTLSCVGTISKHKEINHTSEWIQKQVKEKALGLLNSCFLGEKFSPAAMGANVSSVLIVVQSLRCVWLFATPWTAACQPSPSFTISRSWLKLMSIKSVMPSNHLILCCPLLLLPSIFSSIRVFFIILHPYMCIMS